MNRRSPPADVAALVARAHALVGHSLFEIACALGAADPEGGLHGKGQAGALLEHALGAPPTSGKMHDFPELGVELKTVPRAPSGTPSESTYVCHFALDQAPSMTWESSWVRAKLRRVLWIATSAARTPWRERMVQGAWLWTPTPEQDALLRADFEELVGLAARGRIDELSASRGAVMQVRPKAANGRVRTHVLTDNGERIATVPRGFYLRARFVRDVLEGLEGHR